MIPDHAIYADAPTVTKLWGKEYWLENNEKYCLKLLKVVPGFQCSLHFHAVKDETFLVLHGVVKLQVQLPDDVLHLGIGDKYRLEPGRPHRFSSETLTPAWILETSTHHDDADSYRIEDSRKI